MTEMPREPEDEQAEDGSGMRSGAAENDGFLKEEKGSCRGGAARLFLIKIP